MTIRTLQAPDYAQVDFLMQQLHRIHVEGRPDLFQELEHPYSQEEYEEMLENPRFISIGAEESGRLCGICFVSLRERAAMSDIRTAYMEDLIVAENCRRRGVARALFTEAELRAQEQGAKRLELMVWAFNQGALNLYMGLGMRERSFILEKDLL